MQKTTLYLPDELQRQLQEAARRMGRSQADLIREALETFLGTVQPPKARSIGLGDNPDLHGEDTEDWLRQNWRAKWGIE
jgi:Arc/MetJ-type ribon-helix-helix transcriptional regulator